MQERISFFTYKGKSIMFIDFSHSQPKEILPLLNQIQITVARHERNSVLIFSDMTGAHIDRASAQRMKEVLVLDTPFVKRAAWIGVESIPKAYIDNFKSFSHRELTFFDTREEALEWLVREEK
jgi:hypothetical protein